MTNIEKTLIAALLLLMPLVSKAQIGEHRNDFAIGVNAGYVLSNVSFDPSVPQGMHGGITGGISARYVSEKYFKTICSIYAELNYASIGWKEDIKTADDKPVYNAAIGADEKYSRTVSYIQLPVFAHLAWGRENKGFNFFINLGPQFGYYLSESTSTNYTMDNVVTPNTVDENGNYIGRSNSILAQDTMKIEHKLDYGIAGGIGAEYSVPKVGHFLAEVRYYYGLGNIFGSSKRDFFGTSHYGNIVFKLSYLFDISRTKNVKRK